MKATIPTGLTAAFLGIAASGAAFAQAGADYEMACIEALAEQAGVEQSQVEIGTAEEVAGSMKVNLTLDGADWVCTLDAAGGVAMLEEATG